MTRHTNPRRIELMLLTLTLFTALCGLTLVFWGKRAIEWKIFSMKDLTQ